MTEKEFHADAVRFLDGIFADLKDHSVVLNPKWSIDHVCFRANTEEAYVQFRAAFAAFGDLLVESPIGGRSISTFKLHRPIVYQNYEIPLVELPEPKKGKLTDLGFDHIEVVCDLSFDVLEQMYAHLDLDLKGLQKSVNKDLEIVFGKRSLKFHHASLEAVIEEELRS